MIRKLEFPYHPIGDAGFHPIKVIQHATGNNARILGMKGQIGGVRPGYLADLIVVNRQEGEGPVGQASWLPHGLSLVTRLLRFYT